MFLSQACRLPSPAFQILWKSSSSVSRATLPVANRKSRTFLQAEATRKQAIENQQNNSKGKNEDKRKIEEAMLPKGDTMQKRISSKEIDKNDHFRVQKSTKLLKLGPSKYDQDEARLLRHRVALLDKKRKWRKVVVEIQEARSKKIIVSPETLNSAMRCFSKDGRWKEASDMLQDAKSRGESISIETYAINIDLLARAGKGAKAFDLWKELNGLAEEKGGAQGGFELSQDAFAAGMEALAAVGKGNEALELFQNVTHPGVEMYTARVSAFASLGQWNEAVAAIGEMRSLQPPLKPSSRTYGNAMKACVSVKEFEQAAFLLKDMLRRNLRPGSKTFAYGIAALGGIGDIEGALKLIPTMRSFQVTVTPSVYHSLQQALIKCGKPELAVEVLDSMAAFSDCNPNMHNFMAALMACARAGMGQRAILLLEDIKASGVPLNNAAITYAMEACNKEGDAEKSLAILGGHLKNGAVLTSQLGMAGLEACASTGNFESAMTMLEVLEEGEVPPRAIAYLSVIKAMAKGNFWQGTANLVHKLRVSGKIPLKKVYREAIAVCARAGQWRIAYLLLQDMRDHTSGSTSAFLWNIVAGSMGRAQRWEEALNLIHEGLKIGVLFDQRTISTAMYACYMNQQWEKVLEIEQIGEKIKIPLSNITSSMALQACEKLGNLNAATLIQEKVEKLQIEPALDVELNSLFSLNIDTKST